jgi:hypothetical protein
MPEFIVRVGTPDGTITERHVQAMSVRAAEEDLRSPSAGIVFDARRQEEKPEGLRDGP